MTVHELVHASGVTFGTSGARGLVEAMTDEVCHGYATGFLRHLMAQGCWRPGRAVALGGDLRPSTPRIMAACGLAVQELGGTPQFCGFVPTPALALHAISEEIPAIMVTGSHIPDDRNGIKFYRPDGEILKAEERLIFGQRVGRGNWPASGMLETLPLLGPEPSPGIAAAYMKRYLDAFGSGYLQGLRIGVYQHSAVGRDLLAALLDAMGAKVTVLGRADRFIPVDTEAVRPEDVALARQWAGDYAFDAIVSTDGDSDRPLVADETGQWLRGDVLAMLCARELGMKTVITPVSSNTVVERCGTFERVKRTRIGSPYVIKAMQRARAEGETMVCGYEANGGFLLGSDLLCPGSVLSALPTRDAVLPIIVVLAAVRHTALSQLVSALPRRVTFSSRITRFSPERSKALFAWLTGSTDAQLAGAFAPIAGVHILGVDWTDGVRMRFANDRVIHLRSSGNAPELRCYSEADDDTVAQYLAQAALALVASRF